MLISSWATDGEVICNVCYGSKYKHGIAFQFIDPMRLDPTQYEELSNGNVVRHGIEMDEDNHPVAYHFQKPVERMYSLGSRNTIRIPAENIIHWFLPEKIGQKRGLPPARTALSRMRMVSKFEDATITNAFAGSAAAGVTRSNDADDPKRENLPLHLEPGKIYDIGNREFSTFQTQFPEASIEIFLRTLLRSIGAGLNVSYHNLANDLTSVNFSSIRQGALDERTVWEGLQNSFCKGVVVPMFEKWLEAALLNQMITIYGKPLKIERLKKYQAVEFIGRRWTWIDPAAEQTANERAVAQGFKSRSQVIRETSNRDPEDVWDEIKRENLELEKRGITPLIPSGSVPPPSNEGNHEANTV
jgi:lambda family phage portal protein